jgi:hypothetical protein
MNHLSEEQLILHYYGETGETGEPGETGAGDAAGDAAGDSLACERHLEECGNCRALYASLQRVLNVVDGLPVPERSADYGAQVWQRIERRLEHSAGARRRRLWMLPASWRLAAAGAALAALLVTAFVAGRFYPRPQPPAQVAADAQTGERVLLVAVGDYLERSQMVLIELTNANPKGSLDISAEQERAGGLVTETRLYRQTAARTGDARITGVLDELERVLVDITHAPSNMTPGQLEELRQRLEAEGILFKIRVLGSNVRNQTL